MGDVQENNNGIEVYNSNSNIRNGTLASNNAHLFEIHKHNAKEMFPIIKALMFRDVSFF